jgi:hypothetical protein
MKHLRFAAVTLVCFAGCAEDEDLSESTGTDTGEAAETTPQDSTLEDTESDTGAAETIEADSTVPDTFVADTFAADTFIADTFVADTFVADTFVPDTFVPDTFVPDTFVPDTFMPDTAPVDTCVGNPCGGCNALTTPPPGIKCGTCLTSAYVCSASSESTVCSNPSDGNVCGGCGTITSPAPGTACGICGTYTCNAAKTATTCSDPAVVSTDFSYDSTMNVAPKLYGNTYAFAYPTKHKGRVVSVALRIFKSTEPVSFVAPGGVTLEVLRGTPAAPGASLGSTTIAQASIPDFNPSGAPVGYTTFTISSAVTVPVGDPIFAKVTMTGNAYGYYFYGSSTGSDAGPGPIELVTYRDGANANFDPAINVQMNGCF